MSVKFKYSFLIPILVGVWYPTTFVITYVMAVLNNDVTPIFPYISDTGNWSPESCVFGLMLNMGSILMILTIYIRFRQVHNECARHNFEPYVNRWNRNSAILGYIAAFGIVLVGNFQETNVLVVHILGAILGFGLGAIYQCMQTRISFAIFPTIGHVTVNYLRILLACMSILTFFVSFLFGTIAFMNYHGDDVTKWTKEDGGFTFHMISTVTEWVMALSTMFFLVTFSGEFKRIVFIEPEIQMQDGT